jgi:hypothetical protein
MHIRDRIKDLRRVRAGDLRPHPKNWRKHPEEQQNALRGILAEVGYVDALMVPPVPDDRPLRTCRTDPSFDRRTPPQQRARAPIPDATLGPTGPFPAGDRRYLRRRPGLGRIPRYWAHADGFDADSAKSRAVRSKLVNRSRYEVANNVFADGMTQTHANYLVGKGPALRIQEFDADFARRIELEFC